MTRSNNTQAVAETARHIRAARDQVERQRTLIAKFEREGLDVTSEKYLLDRFQTVLMRDEARMGRLLYEDDLGRDDGKAAPG